MRRNKVEGQLSFDFSIVIPVEKMEPVEKESKKILLAENSKGKNFFTKSLVFAKNTCEKWKNNIKAIKLSIKLGDSQADEQQQEVLAKYAGWGDLGKEFEREEKSVELKDLVGEKKFNGIRSSILTSYYTPDTIIKFIYKILDKLGVKGKLNILDPAMGTGNFFRFMPESLKASNLYGVELESTCGTISKQLFPEAKIQIGGFEDVKLESDYFDLVIGNVPFGDYSCYDTTFGSHLIHDYFFLKSFQVVRLGGIVALITSKGTFDKKSDKVRRLIGKRAKLLYAVRLPETAFKTAGAKVTTDILIFQKLEYYNTIPPEWILSDGDLNTYYQVHPEYIFGKMKKVSGPFGEQITCAEDAPLEDYIEAAVKNVHLENAFVLESSHGPEDDTSITAVEGMPNMSYGILYDEVYYRKDSRMHKVAFEGIKKKRVVGMIEIREALQRLISMEIKDIPDKELEADRRALNKMYDAFVKRYGLIHSRGNKMVFQKDASYYLLCSLEILDEDNRLKQKADILSQRTIVPHSVIDTVDTARDALTCSLKEKGGIDFEYMLSIYRKKDSKADLIKELRGWIFKNPETGKYETKSEYLSGNVRQKLQIAKLTAQKDTEYNIQVEALKQVQPKPLKANEIDARLGATWIDPGYIRDFLIEIFHAPKEHFDSNSMSVNYVKELDQWRISWERDSSNQTAAMRYGTKRRNGYAILEDSLNLKDTKIYDTIYDEGVARQALNQEETALAMAKQEEIRESFKSWIFIDYDRRKQLEMAYNERFNSRRFREFDGSFLDFRNMSKEIQLRKHQKDAVMRILHSQDNSLIAHKVGYGKTYTAIAAVMEAKRLKLSEKNLIVVPNALVGQWGEDFMRLYPGANILVASEYDFTPARRMEFCSRIATGEYDAIIIAHSQFQKIPISQEYEKKFIEIQIDELNNILSEDNENCSIRVIESKKKKLEVSLKKLQDLEKKDNVISFEQLGVTKLIIDEAHYFKNLYITTKMNNIAGLNTNSNSKRAFDLFLKCRYMEEFNQNKGVVFLTGTPVSNSMAEIYTMQRFLQYKTLVNLGISTFDSWASTFGETKTIMELAPEGSGYHTRTRFTKFVGLPELLSIFKEIADIKVKDIPELNVPTPHPITISLDASDEQKQYVECLGIRAKRIRSGGVKPEEDNMLKVTLEGRKLALDQRLIGIEKENYNSKTKACADCATDIYQKYPGKTQIIFCDISTPKKGQFNVYDDVKEKLIKRGIPQEKIEFIHSAKTAKQKVDLCKRVDEGKISILLGSTDKAGTGCNFQSRLIAEHDLDCPWRPSDLTQRSGRIIRQGNHNSMVFIYRYVTKNTFDSYMWQTVENKQRYISQILSEEDIPRRMKEDETTLSYAEIKAAACGDPKIKEQMELTRDVQNLKLRKNEFLNQYYNLESYVREIAPQRVQQYKDIITRISQDQCKADRYKDKEFLMKICGYKFDNAHEASSFIHTLEGAFDSDKVIGSYKGFELVIPKKRYFEDRRILLKGEHNYEMKYFETTNIVYQMQKMINNLSAELDVYTSKLHDEERKFATAKVEVNNTEFPYEKELILKEERLGELNLQLSA